MQIWWKNGVICLVSMFPYWFMVLKLSKNVQFLWFCADLSKKSKSVKTTYIFASEDSHYLLSENSFRCWISRNLTKFFDFKLIFPKKVCHIIINNTIFWMCVTRPFRCIYKNCFNTLSYLVEGSTKWQKRHLFGEFGDHNLGSKHRN